MAAANHKRFELGRLGYVVDQKQQKLLYPLMSFSFILFVAGARVEATDKSANRPRVGGPYILRAGPTDWYNILLRDNDYYTAEYQVQFV